MREQGRGGESVYQRELGFIPGGERGVFLGARRNCVLKYD